MVKVLWMRRQLSRARRDRGFTLIELLVVVVIIGILAAVVLPNYFGVGEKAKKGRAQAELRSIGSAVLLYAAEKGQWPGDFESDQPNVGLGDYGFETVPKDPWNGKYVWKESLYYLYAKGAQSPYLYYDVKNQKFGGSW